MSKDTACFHFGCFFWLILEKIEGIKTKIEGFFIIYSRNLRGILA
jgi:hypothetical protein